MKPIQYIALLLVLYGLILHTYIELAGLPSFSIGFWIWSLSPYIVGVLLLSLAHQPHATVGALILPVLFDTLNFYSLFFMPPGNSTSSLSLFFVPLWNLFIFTPIGGAIGWWVGKRSKENSAV